MTQPQRPIRRNGVPRGYATLTSGAEVDILIVFRVLPLSHGALEGFAPGDEACAASSFVMTAVTTAYSKSFAPDATH